MCIRDREKSHTTIVSSFIKSKSYGSFKWVNMLCCASNKWVKKTPALRFNQMNEKVAVKCHLKSLLKGLLVIKRLNKVPTKWVKTKSQPKGFKQRFKQKSNQKGPTNYKLLMHKRRVNLKVLKKSQTKRVKRYAHQKIK